MTRLSMDDVGKRIDHLTELKDLWEEGLEHLKRRDVRYRTPVDDANIAKIENALELLNAHMLCDFQEIDVIRLRNQINRIKEDKNED